MCCFTGVQLGNYLEGEPIRRNEVEARLGKNRNGKSACKDQVTGKMIKVGHDMVVN